MVAICSSMQQSPFTSNKSPVCQPTPAGHTQVSILPAYLPMYSGLHSIACALFDFTTLRKSGQCIRTEFARRSVLVVKRFVVVAPSGRLFVHSVAYHRHSCEASRHVSVAPCPHWRRRTERILFGTPRYESVLGRCGALVGRRSVSVGASPVVRAGVAHALPAGAAADWRRRSAGPLKCVTMFGLMVFAIKWACVVSCAASTILNKFAQILCY